MRSIPKAQVGIEPRSLGPKSHLMPMNQLHHTNPRNKSLEVYTRTIKFKVDIHKNCIQETNVDVHRNLNYKGTVGIYRNLNYKDKISVRTNVN